MGKQKSIFITQKNTLYCILKLNNNEIVASGLGGTFFYNLKEKKQKCFLEKVKCNNIYSLIRINNNQILTFYNNIFSIVDINNMNTIQHEIIINNFYGIIYKGLYLFFIYSYESLFYHKIFHINKIQNKTNEIDKKIEELSKGNMLLLCDFQSNNYAYYSTNAEFEILNIIFN